MQAQKHYIAIEILMLVMIVNHKYVLKETLVWCQKVKSPISRNFLFIQSPRHATL